MLYNSRPIGKRGRAVECTGLENRQGFIALREFESLRFRQIYLIKSVPYGTGFFV